MSEPWPPYGPKRGWLLDLVVAARPLLEMLVDFDPRADDDCIIADNWCTVHDSPTRPAGCVIAGALVWLARLDEATS